MLYTFVRIQGSDLDVEEIVQETFVKAFLNISTLKNPGNIKAWLFSICRNCINSSLKFKRNSPMQLSDIDLEFTEITNIESRSSVSLDAVLLQLKPEKNLLLRLKYYAGFNYCELGLLLGINEQLVKSRLYEYRKELKSNLLGLETSQIFKKNITLQEKIMKKIKTIQKAAEIISSLSLKDQLLMVSYVKNNIKLDSEILKAFAEIEGAKEILSSYHGKFSMQEYSDILCVVSVETKERIFRHLEKVNANLLEEIQSEMPLAELRNIPDESLVLTPEKLKDCPDTLIVYVKGYLDIYNSSVFEEKLLKIIRDGIKKLILDFGEFDYISSTGINSMIVLRRVIEEEKGVLIISRLKPDIWNILEMLGLSDFFNKIDSVNQALVICRGDEPVIEEPVKLCEITKGINNLPTGSGGDDNINFYSYCFPNEYNKSIFEYKQLSKSCWAFIFGEIADVGKENLSIKFNITSSFHEFFEHETKTIDLKKLAYLINNRITAMEYTDRFVVFYIIIVDIETGECRVVNSGYNNFCIYRDTDRRIENFTLPNNVVTGVLPSDLIMRKKEYQTSTFKLNPNDVIYLYTDVMEELLGTEYIHNFISRRNELNIERSVNALIKQAELLDEDILIFALKI